VSQQGDGNWKGAHRMAHWLVMSIKVYAVFFYSHFIGITSDDLTIASLNQELVESMKRVENLEMDLQVKCELIKGFQAR